MYIRYISVSFNLYRSGHEGVPLPDFFYMLIAKPGYNTGAPSCIYIYMYEQQETTDTDYQPHSSPSHTNISNDDMF